MEKVVYLISGGIDSPVAAYLGIKKGWRPVFVHFDNFPFTDESTKEKAIKMVRHLINITGMDGGTLLVPHGRDLEIIVQRCKRNLSCLLCKRMMYRKAEIIAKKYGCGGIITGEIIGEQASQTLRNLILNSRVIEMPIIRPLLGMNKIEVESIAKRIGTYELSLVAAKPCGAAAIKARTQANEPELSTEEKKIPIPALLEESIKNATLLERV
jgi:thiamine biosynthesis protein ThiI